MKDLSDNRLTEEFDRLANLKGECEASMFEIREEQSRRKTSEIEKLQVKLDSLQ